MPFCQVVLKRELLAKIGNLWDAPPPSIDTCFNSKKRSDTRRLDTVSRIRSIPSIVRFDRDAFPYSIITGNAGIDHRAIVELRTGSREKIFVSATT